MVEVLDQSRVHDYKGRGSLLEAMDFTRPNYSHKREDYAAFKQVVDTSLSQRADLVSGTERANSLGWAKSRHLVATTESPRPQPTNAALELPYSSLRLLMFQLNGLHPNTEKALQSSLDRLDEIASLAPDWNPRGSKSSSSNAILAAYFLLFEVAKRIHVSDKYLTIPYYISPIVNGGVSISWRSQWAQLRVMVGPLGKYRYYWEDRRDFEMFEEQADVTLDALLQQVEKTLILTRERS